MSQAKPQSISPEAVRALIRSEQPYALIDLRELGAFSSGHLLLASCLPLSRLDLLAPSKLPAKHLPIVLLSASEDDADLTERGAAVLLQAGYTQVQVLAGGTQAWQLAGGEVFTGVNVPSKAFGEFVEHWHDTPRVSAAELFEWQQRAERILILDSRPFDEFRKMSIPDGRDCPGAELVRRIHDEIDDDDTVVVVNCAGRTRSIIGAQSLINAGIRNPVFALKDGTMGWKLAGLQLAHGKSDLVPEPSEAGLAAAVTAANRVANQCLIEQIDRATLKAWESSDESVTVLLDVRTEQEYLQGHWPGAIHAPGGQLVQATDEYVMVRNARLVLCDSPDGVRGNMTAHWLLQMGWREVRLLVEAPARAATGRDVPHQSLPAGAAEISAKEWAAKRADYAAQTIVLDLSVSRHYRAGHLPGAAWTTRARLAQALSTMMAQQPDARTVLLTGPGDGLLALAAQDVMRLHPEFSVLVLAGGVGAWMAAGHPVQGESEHACWIHAPDDVWVPPTEGKVNAQEAMQQYLDWEVGLVEQVNREGLVTFNRLI
ncbi:MAG: rhodanese-like domain-containing protein [Burkholderiaceae bacterium]